MSYPRIGALVLFLISLSCAGCGIIGSVAPLFAEIRALDGTLISPGIALLGGLQIIVVAVVIAIASGILWWVVHPRLASHAQERLTLDQIREMALRSYMDWLVALQILRSEQPAQANLLMRQNIQSRTLSMLTLLDMPRKRMLMKFLYDLQLITGPNALDLSGADLRGVVAEPHASTKVYRAD